MPNPYFDDSDAPEVVAASGGLPEWANITSDLVDTPADIDNSPEPQVTPQPPAAPQRPTAPVPVPHQAPAGYAPVAAPPQPQQPVPVPIPLPTPQPQSQPVARPVVPPQQPTPPQQPALPHEVPSPVQPQERPAAQETTSPVPQPNVEDHASRPAPQQELDVDDAPRRSARESTTPADPWEEEAAARASQKAPPRKAPPGSRGNPPPQKRSAPPAPGTRKPPPSRRGAPPPSTGGRPAPKKKPAPAAGRRPATKGTARGVKKAPPPTKRAPGRKAPPPGAKGAKSGQPRKVPSSGGKWGGARKGALIIKIAVWSVLALLLVAGLRAVFMPPRTDYNTITAVVADAIGIEKFPMQEGEAIATAFARAYLNNPPNNGERRTADLRFLVPGIPESAMSLPAQRLVSGPFLLGKPEILDDGRAVYTFGGQVEPLKVPTEEGAVVESAGSPQWTYIAVPVFADETMNVKIAGLPAFVPVPAFATESSSFGFQRDPEIEPSLKVDLQAFFAAWADTDEAVISKYVSPEDGVVTSPSVTAGLGGTVEFVGLSELEAEYVNSFTEPIRVNATVQWRDGDRVVEQSYRLIVLYKDGQTWYVQDISGGAFTR